MKKVFCMIAVAAISLGSVCAYAGTPTKSTVAVTDTVKKVKPRKTKVKKTKSKMKDSSSTTKMK